MKAYEFDDKEEYEKALNLLLRNFKTAQKHQEKIPEFFVLLGELYIKLGDLENGVCWLMKSYELIDTTKTLNDDEKRYLKEYVHEWFEIIDENTDITVKNLPKLSFDINKVRKSLKTNFPLKSRK